MWGAIGRSKLENGFTFVSKLAIENAVFDKLDVKEVFTDQIGSDTEKKIWFVIMQRINRS